MSGRHHTAAKALAATLDAPTDFRQNWNVYFRLRREKTLYPGRKRARATMQLPAGTMLRKVGQSTRHAFRDWVHVCAFLPDADPEQPCRIVEGFLNSRYSATADPGLGDVAPWQDEDEPPPRLFSQTGQGSATDPLAISDASIDYGKGPMRSSAPIGYPAVDRVTTRELQLYHNEHHLEVDQTLAVGTPFRISSTPSEHGWHKVRTRAMASANHHRVGYTRLTEAELRPALLHLPVQVPTTSTSMPQLLPEQVVQGGLGDCFLLAALTSLLQRGFNVADLVPRVDTGRGKSVLRLYNPREARFCYYEIDNTVLRQAGSATNFGAPEALVGLVEKVYAAVTGKIEFQSTAAALLRLTGERVSNMKLFASPFSAALMTSLATRSLSRLQQGSKQAIIEAHPAATCLTVISVHNDALAPYLPPRHAFAVVAADDHFITLDNPHGQGGWANNQRTADRRSKLRWDQFFNCFGCVTAKFAAPDSEAAALWNSLMAPFDDDAKD